MSPVWSGFIVFVCLLLWLDLGVLNRRAHIIGTREALRWTVLWVSIALLFSGFVWLAYDHHWLGEAHAANPHYPHSGFAAWQQYVAGYLAELSLSMDNIFVIALIFAYFGVPAELQHRTLFWGIVGAMVFRGIMIAVGAALITRYEWTVQLFGVLLLVTAVRMLFSQHEDVHPDHNPLVTLARRFYPVSPSFDGQRFFTRLEGGRRAMTPLFVVLLVIESTDVIFAVDSIPAIFGITRDAFLVFTSNVFAILGLRSMFFVLAGMMRRFAYLKYSLVALLLFIAIKMIFELHLEPGLMLLIIVLILAAGIAISLVSSRRRPVDSTLPDVPDEQSSA